MSGNQARIQRGVQARLSKMAEEGASRAGGSTSGWYWPWLAVAVLGVASVAAVVYWRGAVKSYTAVASVAADTAVDTATQVAEQAMTMNDIRSWVMTHSNV